MSPDTATATESKAWWASRTIWAGIVSALAGIAGVAGYSISPDDQAQIVTLAVGVASLLGGAGAIVGRIRARKAVTGNSASGTPGA